MTTLFGWGAMFGCQSPSPFVIKADVQLQMLGVPFDREIADLDAVPKHKAPYVEDEGRIIEDSTFIRWHFEAKLGADLDHGLTAEQRAIAWATERMFEDRLASIMGHERWLESDNFERGPALFFAAIPEPMRAGVIADTLDRIRTGYEISGIGRHSRAERMQLAQRDIEMAAALLGDKPYFLADRATALDGIAYGVLTACASPVFDSPLRDMVATFPNLTDYFERMEKRFFNPNRWPSMTAAAEAA
ncbi:glutathione S-transferase family protein [Sphingopyxis sp. DHUNG17]|uniref:glutathione S-transferase family protein n=1 Tax=Sphingopyxis jiangsuensis TaxID=2871171 RepID=UPI00191CF3EE|nr:glutathione S-transferase family protein [Sphingopyxis lutea]